MKRKYGWLLSGSLVLVLLLAACSVAAPQASESEPVDSGAVAEEAEDSGAADEMMTTDSGLQYVILEEGSGDAPQPGDTVRVHYTGTLEDGTQFDSSAGRDPIEFALGTGRVIPGWDEGIALLKEGSKARFVIPPNLAYGDRENGAIPANSTLIFEVELVEVVQ
jgi:FKBP-type peptidyl-prolyl cis-trans isomerase